jgi:hypothetical protein
MSISISQRGLMNATLAVGLLAAAGGCGGSYNASVRGTATLNQTPLQSGTVNFTPQQPGPSGYGLIESNGSYAIMTGRAKGLPAGTYVVTVVSNEPSVPVANPSAPPTPGKPITPAWYRDTASSPLKYTVEPGRNKIDLELTSQPPAGWKPGKK